MLLMSRICHVLTVYALTWHVPRVALQEGMENASHEQDLSCFSGVCAHLACLQSGSAVAALPSAYWSLFLVFYGARARLACLQSGSTVAALPYAPWSLFLVF